MSLKGFAPNAGFAWAVSILVVLRVFVVALIGPTFAPDSSRYLKEGLLALDLTGADGSPAPLVQLVWLTPIPLPVLIQATASGVCWGLLALAVSRIPASGRVALAGFLIVTAFSWLPMVVSFDTLALTDSLSISGLVLAMASVIAGLTGPPPRLRSTTWPVLLAVGVAMAVLSRPTNLLLATPIALAALVLSQDSPIGGSWLRDARRGRAVQVGAALTIVVVSLYGVFLGIGAGGSSTEGFRAENRLALRASPAFLGAAKVAGLPQCPSLPLKVLSQNSQLAYTYLGIGPLQQRLILPNNQDARDAALGQVRNTDCLEMTAWLAQGHMTPFETALGAPVDTLRQYALDQLAQWTPVMQWDIDKRLRLFDPAFIVVGTITALAYLASVLIVNARRRGGTWRQVPRRVVLLVTTALLSTLAFSFGTWIVDAIELGRHFLPASILAAPALFVLAIALSEGAERSTS